MLRRVAAGDEAALARLFDVLGPAVLAVATRRCTTQEDVDRFVLGVFLSIWRSAPRFLLQDRSAALWITDLIASPLAVEASAPSAGTVHDRRRRSVDPPRERGAAMSKPHTTPSEPSTVDPDTGTAPDGTPVENPSG